MKKSTRSMKRERTFTEHYHPTANDRVKEVLARLEYAMNAMDDIINESEGDEKNNMLRLWADTVTVKVKVQEAYNL